MASAQTTNDYLQDNSYIETAPDEGGGYGAADSTVGRTQLRSPASLDVSPPSLSWSGAQWGQALTVIVSNGGGMATSEISAVISQGPFMIAANSCHELDEGEDCELRVMPSNSGTGTLMVSAQFGGSASVSLTAVNTVIGTGGVTDPYRWSNGYLPTSCKGYLSAYAPSGFPGRSGSNASDDGIYRIDVDGAGGQPAFDVYCNMSRQGGGWTLVANREGEYSGCYAPTPGTGRLTTVTSSTLTQNDWARSVTDQRWVALRNGAADILVLEAYDPRTPQDDYDFVGQANIARLNAASNCKAAPPSTLTDGVLWWQESSGCGNGGVDYCMFMGAPPTALWRGRTSFVTNVCGVSNWWSVYQGTDCVFGGFDHYEDLGRAHIYVR